MYKKYTNGCSPNDISVEGNTIEINFGFIEPLFKRFTITISKDVGDGDFFADLSIIELYKDRLYNNNCNSFSIKKVSGMGIMLCFSDDKVFIPCYHHFIYYTGDVKMNIKYEKFEGGKIIESEETEIDLSNDFLTR